MNPQKNIAGYALSLEATGKNGCLRAVILGKHLNGHQWVDAIAEGAEDELRQWFSEFCARVTFASGFEDTGELTVWEAARAKLKKAE